jgi:hypothetical protein
MATSLHPTQSGTAEAQNHWTAATVRKTELHSRFEQSSGDIPFDINSRELTGDKYSLRIQGQVRWDELPSTAHICVQPNMIDRKRLWLNNRGVVVR